MLKKLSIKYKLITIILVISSFVIMLGMTITMMNNIIMLKKQISNQFQLNAKLYSQSVAPGIVFNMKDKTKDILSQLEYIPNITHVQIYDTSFTKFVTYTRTGFTNFNLPKSKKESYTHFEGDVLNVFEPIHYMGEDVGVLFIRSNTHLSDKILDSVYIMIILMVILFVIAYFMASKLQKIISNPILELTNITTEITDNSDYSVRLKNKYYDEIGLLFDEFNQMLEVIQHRAKERDIAEENLRDSELRYRRLTENAKDAIFRISIPDGFYEYMSPAILEMTGYTPSDFYKDPFFMKKIIHPSFHAWYEAVWGDLIYGKLLPAYEYQIVDKFGEIHWLYQRSVVVRDSQGKPIALEAIATDITDRKMIEEEVKTLNAELEDRVQRRTAELQSANNELKDFAYVVSHDLKAPLRGISQLSQWFLQDYKDELDPAGQELAVLLIKRVDRLNKLINGILEYSRVGSVVNKVEKLDVGELIHDVVDLLNPPDKMTFNYPIHLPVIYADRIRIEQVFQNIISNSIKYIDKPEGKIEIIFDEDDKFYRFAIKDNGVGIENKYHEKIFGIFQTLEQKEDNENTGIGLSIVKKIVELYGGTVWVESVVGEQTIFHFSLLKKIVAYE